MKPARVLAVAALILGAAAPFAGSPYASARGRIDVAEFASIVAHEEDHVTALELAGWIRDRKPGLRVIDVRLAAEYDAYRIPTSENVPLEDLARLHLNADETAVIYSGGGAHGAQAWVFMRATGHREVYFLRGGIDEWLDEVMNPVASTPLTRYFGGMARPPGSGAEPALPGETTEERVKRLRRRGC